MDADGTLILASADTLSVLEDQILGGIGSEAISFKYPIKAIPDKPIDSRLLGVWENKGMFLLIAAKGARSPLHGTWKYRSWDQHSLKRQDMNGDLYLVTVEGMDVVVAEISLGPRSYYHMAFKLDGNNLSIFEIGKEFLTATGDAVEEVDAGDGRKKDVNLTSSTTLLARAESAIQSGKVAEELRTVKTKLIRQPMNDLPDQIPAELLARWQKEAIETRLKEERAKSEAENQRLRAEMRELKESTRRQPQSPAPRMVRVRCSNCGGSGEHPCIYRQEEDGLLGKGIVGCDRGTLKTIKSSFRGTPLGDGEKCRNCGGRGIVRCAECGGQGGTYKQQ